MAEYTCRSTGITSSRLRMYTDAFFAMPVVRPPIEEQRVILKMISAETESIDKARHLAEREIDLIKEFRVQLISDVVTGKLDVRRIGKTEARLT